MNHFELASKKPTLGFGLMRMPEADGQIDLEQVKAMVDAYLQAGFNYFDTAWGYHGGLSEGTLKAAVVDRYPREAFRVATKFPIWAVNEQADVQKTFDTQMERTGAGYFDYYMIHAIGAGNIEKIDQYDIWSFLRQQKQKGLAKHIGFSFHDSAAMLEGLLDKHPEVEFVQLQINYADWDDEKVQSRLCYEACMKRGVAVIIMEPVKGGSLASIVGEAEQLLLAARPNDSVASWAMRYCGTIPGAIVVLSGMSDMEQMRDNIKTMRDFVPLTEAERATVAQVLAVLKRKPTIPCTNCRYCVEQCPQEINIPGILDNYNNVIKYNNVVGMKRAYKLFSTPKAKASDCVQCGVCESRCPQKIEIVEALRKCAQLFEA